MAKLTSKQRGSMSLSEFALPGRRFPMEDATHQREAISGATRSYHAGNISLGQMARVKRKARAKLNGANRSGY